jgi:ankyrin repeat protein
MKNPSINLFLLTIISFLGWSNLLHTENLCLEFHQAILDNNKDKVEEMLKNSQLDPNCQNENGDNCLHLMAQMPKFNFDIFYSLPKVEALNAKNSHNDYPLNTAVKFNNLTAFKEFFNKIHKSQLTYLIDNQDVDGKTSLHWALLHTNKNMIITLLKNNADFKIKDRNGITAQKLSSKLSLIPFKSKLMVKIVEDYIPQKISFKDLK